MIRNALVNGAKAMGLNLSDENIKAFELYAAELKKWNRKINLTAITSDREIAIKHFVDSLMMVQELGEADCVLDIGSGAGLPALPIKIVRPDLDVTSVDAVAKKINFQRHVARILRLDSFHAVHARIESLHASHAHKFDVITSRAFSDLRLFVSLAEPLLAKNGRIIAMKGPAAASEISESSSGFETHLLEVSSIRSYSLPDNCGERRLITISTTVSR